MATNTASIGHAMLNNIVANVVSALSNVQGLTGELLNTVRFDFASAISVANTLTDAVLPTTIAKAASAPANLARVTGAPATVPIPENAVRTIRSSVNAVPLPVGITGGTLARMNSASDGGHGLGVVKGRRLKRTMTAEVGHHCEKNVDSEPCILYGDGGGLTERDDQVE